jgi:phosphoglucosamine mutase
VRGVATTASCELSFKLGQAGAYVLTSKVHKARILIGRDTRISGDILKRRWWRHIARGSGAISPALSHIGDLAYLTRHGAEAGVVLSASHNSADTTDQIFQLGRQKAARRGGKTG